MARAVKTPPDLSRLDAFAGHWHAEGDVYSGQEPSHWTSEEHYEWLPGKHFLTYRWDADIGGHPFQGLGVFGHDEKEGLYVDFYDNAGHSPTYRVGMKGTAGLAWK